MKKKLLSLIIAVVFTFSLAGVALAADTGASNAATTAKKTIKHKKAAGKTARARYVTGVVAAVDSTAGTITVKGRKGEVPLNTGEKTVIRKGKAKITLAGIKAGDRVTVRYSEAGGKNVARSVILGGAARKSKKTRKPAAPSKDKSK